MPTLRDIKLNINNGEYFVSSRNGERLNYKPNTLRKNKVEALRDIAKLLGLNVQITEIAEKEKNGNSE